MQSNRGLGKSQINFNHGEKLYNTLFYKSWNIITLYFISIWNVIRLYSISIWKLSLGFPLHNIKNFPFNKSVLNVKQVFKIFVRTLMYYSCNYNSNQTEVVDIIANQWRVFPIEGCLPLKGVFHLMFHWIVGFLQAKSLFHLMSSHILWGLSFIKGNF